MRKVSDSNPRINITQGEYAVSGRADAVMTTILGSCVATCLWDSEAGVGGMNHILVARSAVAKTGDFAGVNAMELLINGLVRLGAERYRLKAKVFGGAVMIDGLSDIGRTNGLFVLEYLEREAIPCLGQSLGGRTARQIRFHPAEGRALQRLVAEAPDPVQAAPKARPPAPQNDVELF